MKRPGVMVTMALLWMGLASAPPARAEPAELPRVNEREAFGIHGLARALLTAPRRRFEPRRRARSADPDPGLRPGADRGLRDRSAPVRHAAAFALLSAIPPRRRRGRAPFHRDRPGARVA